MQGGGLLDRRSCMSQPEPCDRCMMDRFWHFASSLFSSCCSSEIRQLRTTTHDMIQYNNIYFFHRLFVLFLQHYHRGRCQVGASRVENLVPYTAVQILVSFFYTFPIYFHPIQRPHNEFRSCVFIFVNSHHRNVVRRLSRVEPSSSQMLPFVVVQPNHSLFSIP